MGFSPFNSEFDAISDNPPGHGVSHHLTIFQALPLSRERSIPILRRIRLKAPVSPGIHKNKPDGTAIMREHRTSPFVVGAGNANT
jgi:hypothetical protein